MRNENSRMFNFSNSIFVDGQAVAKKVSKTLDQATSSLKKLLCRFNTLKVSSSDATEIPFDEAKNPRTYSDVCDQSKTSSLMPTSLRHKLIEAHCLQERCVEEVDLLNEEIARLTAFYDDQIGILGELCNSLQDGGGGIRSLLERKKLLMLHTFLQLKATLSGKPVEARKAFEVVGDLACVFPSSSFSFSKLDDDKVYIIEHEQEFSSDEDESDEDDMDDIAQ